MTFVRTCHIVRRFFFFFFFLNLEIYIQHANLLLKRMGRIVLPVYKMVNEVYKYGGWFGIVAKSNGFGGFGTFGGVVGCHWEGISAFQSVGVFDEACRLNGSRYAGG